MLTRYTPRYARHGLSGTPGGRSTFEQWGDSIDALLQNRYGSAWRLHGAATVIPSNVPDLMQPYVGQPAMRLDNDAYVALANAGHIDMSRPQVASVNGSWVYILAPDVVVADAPHTMTATEEAENAIFSELDAGATSLGLPSLNGIEDFLKGMGRDVLVGVGVTIAVALLLKRKR